MNTFEFAVELKVKVEAYDEADALDLLEDTFGLGEDCGVTIESRTFDELN